jgi:RNA polymerase sigma factor (sigma-70 family)
LNEDALEAILLNLRESSSDADWDRLYRLIWPYVVTILYRELGYLYLAEEGAQEVMLRLVRYLQLDSTEPRQFLQYLNRICRSVRCDLLRREQPFSRQSSEMNDISPNISDDRCISEERVIAHDVLERALGQLGPCERQLAELMFEGRTAKEISNSTEKNIKTVYNALSTLRKKLRHLLFAAT